MSTKGFSWTPYSRHASVGGKQGGIQLGCDQYQSFYMLRVFGWGLHAVIAVEKKKQQAEGGEMGGAMTETKAAALSSCNTNISS